MTTIICWQCNLLPADCQPRAYREVSTDRVFAGVRNFCSDGCETEYQAKMDLEYPQTVNDFIREL